MHAHAGHDCCTHRTSLGAECCCAAGDHTTVPVTGAAGIQQATCALAGAATFDCGAAMQAGVLSPFSQPVHGPPCTPVAHHTLLLL